MRVFYSGWGYWQWYEESYDEDENIIYIQQGSMPTKACTLFELPKNSAKEITYLGKTITNYLLLSNCTEECEPPSPDALFDSEHEHSNPRFILCEEWEYNYSKRLYEQDEPIKISVTFEEKDIQPPPEDKEMPKPLAETERNKMLMLIIGMAIDGYQYKPNERNSLTGSNKNGLSAKLQTHDISISDDTIRKYLKEAENLL